MILDRAPEENNNNNKKGRNVQGAGANQPGGERALDTVSKCKC